MPKVVCRNNIDADGGTLSSPQGGMSGMDWANLLIESPQFAERCPWSEFDDRAWEQLLSFRPEFAARCDFSKLSALTCRVLFARHRELAPNCAPGTPSEQQDIAWDYAKFPLWVGEGVSCAMEGDSFCDIMRLWCQREKIVQKAFVSLSRFIADQKRNSSGVDEKVWSDIEKGHPLLLSIEVVPARLDSPEQLREEVVCTLRLRGDDEVDADCRTCESRMKCTYRNPLLGEYQIMYDRHGRACRDEFSFADKDDGFRNGCPDKADAFELVGA